MRSIDDARSLGYRYHGNGPHTEIPAPRTIKLSRRFYEQFGDETSNELVDVLNNMDTTYRAELRDFIELSFEKFEARIERRIAQQGADLRTEFRTDLSALRVEMRELKADLVKWMFLFWTGTALANVLLR